MILAIPSTRVSTASQGWRLFEAKVKLKGGVGSWMDLVRRLRLNSIAISNLFQLIGVSFKLSLIKHVCLNLLFIRAADSIRQRFLFSFS